MSEGSGGWIGRRLGGREDWEAIRRKGRIGTGVEGDWAEQGEGDGRWEMCGETDTSIEKKNIEKINKKG